MSRRHFINVTMWFIGISPTPSLYLPKNRRVSVRPSDVLGFGSLKGSSSDMYVRVYTSIPTLYQKYSSPLETFRSRGRSQTSSTISHLRIFVCAPVGILSEKAALYLKFEKEAKRIPCDSYYSYKTSQAYCCMNLLFIVSRQINRQVYISCFSTKLSLIPTYTYHSYIQTTRAPIYFPATIGITV